jgi:hypothetical protein
MENQNQNKWYDNKLVVYLLILLFFPVGLYALWKNNATSKGTKIIVTVLVSLFAIAVLNNDPKTDTNSPAEKVAEQNKQWVDVIKFNGNGDKKSQAFTLTGAKCRMMYKFKTDADMGMFSIYVVAEGDDVMREGGVPELMLQGTEEGETNLSHLGSGDYYLNAMAANGIWGVAIQEYR